MKISYYLWALLLVFFVVGCSREAAIPEKSADSLTELNSHQVENKPNEVEGNSEQGLGYTESLEPDRVISIEESDKYKSELMSMTLEQKIGQLMISGFSGTELSHEEAQLIASGRIGGVILFKQNIESKKQLLNLINDIKSNNPAENRPLFISLDEEGGRVSRLPEGKTEFPPSLMIGKKGDAALSEEVGRVIGEEAGAFGFNVDYAPVLDIFSNPANTVIGDRAYGTTAAEVSVHGIAVMKGLQKAGMISAIKHFPGHGDTSVDSHESLPVVNKTKAQLEERELIPFRKAIEEGADMIMVAHIKYPKIDSSGKPASLSSVMVQDMLRGDLGYDGVVITDDLEMGAIEQNVGSGEAAVMALEAGVDILLFGHTPDKASEAYEAILTAVETGRLSESKIDEHVLRVLKLKEKYIHSVEKLTEDALTKFGSDENQQVADKIKQN
ncbi:beta-N-acetylhexosaminidase [Paenibacillus polygoni]|uniref:beta-N-acetylhexosaminidase n=1 Tax=Paenibacillus polygoni TaxID=3050112 RepID=A0ABY8X5F5_9BACL|nr:beta-N-acetylhexosaminidase [Paenibacillus polygoni]WIV18716.1 beta-N-acetylhexosaminidase [Paenibacillus polygoni]